MICRTERAATHGSSCAQNRRYGAPSRRGRDGASVTDRGVARLRRAAGIGGHRCLYRAPGPGVRAPHPGHHPQGRQGRHHPARAAHRPGARPGDRRAHRRAAVPRWRRATAGPARRRPDRPPGHPARRDLQAGQPAHPAARVDYGRPRRRGPAARRARGRIARRPAHHHALRPRTHQPGPARHLHRRHLRSRGSEVVPESSLAADGGQTDHDLGTSPRGLPTWPLEAISRTAVRRADRCRTVRPIVTTERLIGSRVRVNKPPHIHRTSRWSGGACCAMVRSPVRAGLGGVGDGQGLCVIYDHRPEEGTPGGDGLAGDGGVSARA